MTLGTIALSVITGGTGAALFQVILAIGAMIRAVIGRALLKRSAHRLNIATKLLYVLGICACLGRTALAVGSGLSQSGEAREVDHRPLSVHSGQRRYF